MDWLYPIVAGVIIALIGVVWKMLNDKIDAQAKAITIKFEMAAKNIEDKIDMLWNQIGRDSESGMRQMVHEQTPNRFILEAQDNRITRLEIWRNGKP